MSTERRSKKVFHYLLLAALLGLALSCLRQVSIYYYITRRLNQKQKELSQLEEKNRALKTRLEEVKSPRFLEEQARKVLGLGDAKETALAWPTPDLETKVPEKREPENSNLQKWWRLFVY